MSVAAESGPFSRAHVVAAWGVHIYTALGLALGLASLDALWRDDPATFMLYNLLAVFIDGSDGTLARKLRVREVVPFDGALLDNIADYITYVFLPAAAFVAFGLLPGPWRWAAMAPVLASGYQFCQESAKTDESFVGFPSYWNLVLLYLLVLQPSPAVTAGLLVALSVMVFVPFHYLYPSKTRMWKPFTVATGLIWFAACLAVGLNLDAPWAPSVALASLSYIGYYIVMSVLLHLRITRASAPSSE
jgi:phosphatidylcholine synthase